VTSNQKVILNKILDSKQTISLYPANNGDINAVSLATSIYGGKQICFLRKSGNGLSCEIKKPGDQ